MPSIFDIFFRDNGSNNFNISLSASAENTGSGGEPQTLSASIVSINYAVQSAHRLQGSLTTFSSNSSGTFIVNPPVVQKQSNFLSQIISSIYNLFSSNVAHQSQIQSTIINANLQFSIDQTQIISTKNISSTTNQSTFNLNNSIFVPQNVFSVNTVSRQFVVNQSTLISDQTNIIFDSVVVEMDYSVNNSQISSEKSISTTQNNVVFAIQNSNLIKTSSFLTAQNTSQFVVNNSQITSNKVIIVNTLQPSININNSNILSGETRFTPNIVAPSFTTNIPIVNKSLTISTANIENNFSIIGSGLLSLLQLSTNNVDASFEVGNSIISQVSDFAILAATTINVPFNINNSNIVSSNVIVVNEPALLEFCLNNCDIPYKNKTKLIRERTVIIRARAAPAPSAAPAPAPQINSVNISAVLVSDNRRITNNYNVLLERKNIKIRIQLKD